MFGDEEGLEAQNIIGVDPLLQKKQDDWEALCLDEALGPVDDEMKALAANSLNGKGISAEELSHIRLRNDLRCHYAQLRYLKEGEEELRGRVAFVWLYDAIHGRRTEFPIDATSLYFIKCVRSRSFLLLVSVIALLQMIGPLTQMPSCAASEYSNETTVLLAGGYFSKYALTIFDLICVAFYVVDLVLLYTSDTRFIDDINLYLRTPSVMDNLRHSVGGRSSSKDATRDTNISSITMPSGFTPSVWGSSFGGSMSNAPSATTKVKSCGETMTKRTIWSILYNREWLVLRTVCVLTIFVDCILFFKWRNNPRFSRCLFPILLITRRKNLLIIVHGLIYSARRSVFVQSVLASVIIVWGLIASLTFRQLETNDGNYRFSSVVRSIFTTLHCYSARPIVLPTLNPYFVHGYYATGVYFVLLSIVADIMCSSLIISVGKRLYRDYGTMIYKTRLLYRRNALLAIFYVYCTDPNAQSKHESQDIPDYIGGSAETFDDMNDKQTPVSKASGVIPVDAYVSKDSFMEFARHITGRYGVSNALASMLYDVGLKEMLVEQHRRTREQMKELAEHLDMYEEEEYTARMDVLQKDHDLVPEGLTLGAFVRVCAIIAAKVRVKVHEDEITEEDEEHEEMHKKMIGATDRDSASTDSTRGTGQTGVAHATELSWIGKLIHRTNKFMSEHVPRATFLHGQHLMMSPYDFRRTRANSHDNSRPSIRSNPDEPRKTLVFLHMPGTKDVSDAVVIGQSDMPRPSNNVNSQVELQDDDDLDGFHNQADNMFNDGDDDYENEEEFDSKIVYAPSTPAELQFLNDHTICEKSSNLNGSKKKVIHNEIVSRHTVTLTRKAMYDNIADAPKKWSVRNMNVNGNASDEMASKREEREFRKFRANMRHLQDYCKYLLEMKVECDGTVDKLNPSVDSNETSGYKSWRRSTVAVFALLILLAVDLSFLSKGYSDVSWVILLWVIQICFIFELIISVVASFDVTKSSSLFTIANVTLNIVTISGMIALSGTHSTNGTVVTFHSSSLTLVLITQAMRFPRVIQYTKDYTIYVQLFPIFVRAIVIGFCIIYFFAMIYHNVFCTRLDAAYVEADDYYTADDATDDASKWLHYQDVLNFSSYLQSLFTLFQVATLGNWSIIMDAAAKNQPGTSYSLFLVYRLTMVLFVLPLLLGFIMQTYMQLLQRARQQRIADENEKKKNKELVEEQRRRLTIARAESSATSTMSPLCVSSTTPRSSADTNVSTSTSSSTASSAHTNGARSAVPFAHDEHKVGLDQERAAIPYNLYGMKPSSTMVALWATDGREYIRHSVDPNIRELKRHHNVYYDLLLEYDKAVRGAYNAEQEYIHAYDLYAVMFDLPRSNSCTISNFVNIPADRLPVGPETTDVAVYSDRISNYVSSELNSHMVASLVEDGSGDNVSKSSAVVPPDIVFSGCRMQQQVFIITHVRILHMQEEWKKLLVIKHINLESEPGRGNYKRDRNGLLTVDDVNPNTCDITYYKYLKSFWPIDSASRRKSFVNLTATRLQSASTGNGLVGSMSKENLPTLAAIYVKAAIESRTVVFPQSDKQLRYYKTIQSPWMITLYYCVYLLMLVGPLVEVTYCTSGDNPVTDSLALMHHNQPTRRFLCILDIFYSIFFLSELVFTVLMDTRRKRLNSLVFSSVSLQFFGFLIILFDSVTFFRHNDDPRYSRMLFAVICFCRENDFNQMIRGLYKSTRNSMKIYRLLVAIVVIWGYSGFLLFNRYDTPGSRFATPWEAMMTTLHCFTSNPFMLIAMSPYFTLNNLGPLFFISLTIIAEILCINLIIAIGSTEYKAFAAKNLKLRYTNRRVALQACFQLYAQPGLLLTDVATTPTSKKDATLHSEDSVTRNTDRTSAASITSGGSSYQNASQALVLTRAAWRCICKGLVGTIYEVDKDSIEDLFDYVLLSSSSSYVLTSMSAAVAEAANDGASSIGVGATTDCIDEAQFSRLVALVSIHTNSFHAGKKSGENVPSAGVDGYGQHTVNPMAGQDNADVSKRNNQHNSVFSGDDEAWSQIMLTLRSPDFDPKRFQSGLENWARFLPLNKDVLLSFTGTVPYALHYIIMKCQNIVNHTFVYYSDSWLDFIKLIVVGLLGLLCCRWPSSDTNKKRRTIYTFEATTNFLIFIMIIQLYGYTNEIFYRTDSTNQNPNADLHDGGEFSISTWILFSWLVEVLFFLEMTIRMFAMGFGTYWQTTSTLMDGFCNLVTFFSLLALSRAPETVGFAYYMFVLFQALRLQRAFAYLPGADKFQAIRPIFIRSVVLILAVEYLFAIPAHGLFCAKLDVANVLDADDDSKNWANFNKVMNFSSYLQSAFTLYEIAVIASWSTVVDAVAKETPVLALLFFYTFKLLMLLIVLPLVLGFIIQAFVVALDHGQKSTLAKEQRRSDRAELEARVEQFRKEQAALDDEDKTETKGDKIARVHAVHKVSDAGLALPNIYRRGSAVVHGTDSSNMASVDKMIDTDTSVRGVSSARNKSNAASASTTIYNQAFITLWAGDLGLLDPNVAEILYTRIKIANILSEIKCFVGYKNAVDTERENILIQLDKRKNM